MVPLMAHAMRYSVEAANKGVQQALQQKDVALWLSNKINKNRNERGEIKTDITEIQNKRISRQQIGQPRRKG